MEIDAWDDFSRRTKRKGPTATGDGTEETWGGAKSPTVLQAVTHKLV